MTTASMGWAAQLGTVTESTYGTTPGGGVTERFVFVSESLANRSRIVERNGLRGARSHVADDTRQGTSRPGARAAADQIQGRDHVEEEKRDHRNQVPLSRAGTPQ